MKNSLSFVFTNLERWFDIDFKLFSVPFTHKRFGIVVFWGDKKEQQ